MASWDRNTKGRGGFLLLEAVPALLLLSVLAVLGMRALWLQLSIDRTSQRLSRAVATFPLVWETWQESSGLAAMAVHSKAGGPRILDFPDSSWLPEEAGQDGAAFCLWRRRPWQDGQGLEWWVVEYRLPHKVHWRWYGQILNLGSQLPAEGEPA